MSAALLQAGLRRLSAPVVLPMFSTRHTNIPYLQASQRLKRPSATRGLAASQHRHMQATTACTSTQVASQAANTKVVLVVAVALIDSDHKVLLAQRPEGKPLQGLWEFPGGKIDPGETPEAALCRELQEELNILVRKTRQSQQMARHIEVTIPEKGGEQQPARG